MVGCSSSYLVGMWLVKTISIWSVAVVRIWLVCGRYGKFKTKIQWPVSG